MYLWLKLQSFNISNSDAKEIFFIFNFFLILFTLFKLNKLLKRALINRFNSCRFGNLSKRITIEFMNSI